MKVTVEVVAYNPRWPLLFENEAKRIMQALGDNCQTVHHIGSTSIPGLPAKPIIDMLPVVKNILAVDQATGAMESLGYVSKGEHGIVFRHFFQKNQHYNVHVYEENDPEISRYLKFRDWMRTHELDAQAYARLKQELAKKFPTDILQYCLGKDSFVAQIDAKNGFEGWRMVQALTDREWNAVRAWRQRYFFKETSDPFSWTFTHKDHIHFVFYVNAAIIGYAHLQLLPEKKGLVAAK